MSLPRTSRLIAFSIWLPAAYAGAQPTAIEVFAGSSKVPLKGDALRVPYDNSSLTFSVKAGALPVRYKLEGMDPEWIPRTDEMVFVIRFLNGNGEQISQETFQARGRSEGWNGSVESSGFTQRHETVTVPERSQYISVAISSAGPAALVGIFAVSDINISSADGSPSITYMENSRTGNSGPTLWGKSGPHPSMAYVLNPEGEGGVSPVLVIRDDDANGHADWATGIYELPKVTPGQNLDIRWKETYFTGTSGPFSVTYERLPPGSYRFAVEDLTITGIPAGITAGVAVKVPRPYWHNFWFWAGVAVVSAVISSLIGRHLVRKRIDRRLAEIQLIADERLRIARDLHDDLGTRLSHISLLSSYAETNIADEEAHSTFSQITGLSRDLIRALSETVWMLNSKNNDLESLIDFLCRYVSELCRLAEIPCRIDTLSVTRNAEISHEFRHNMTLAAKETINNALKHSRATEIRMAVHLENSILRIAITDNGVGIPPEANKVGVGLNSLVARLTSIRGKCRIEDIPDGGLKVILEAPLG